MITVKELIEMKKKKMIPFGNQYRWLIMRIEDDLISKLDGADRVKQMLKDYDEQAQLFIISQISLIGKPELAMEIASIIKFDFEKTTLGGEYTKELVDASFF